MRYLFLDVETGGLDFIKHSLLTLFLAVFNENGTLIDSLDLKLKPTDGTYKVTAQGLGVNGINLVEHDKQAISFEAAEKVIATFLRKNTEFTVISATQVEYDHLMPVGCQVLPDIQCIKYNLPKCGWDKYVSYRVQDIVGISRFLMDCKVLPDSKNGLATLAAGFGIKYDAHTAKGDTLATAKVFFSMMDKMEDIMLWAKIGLDQVPCPIMEEKILVDE